MAKRKAVHIVRIRLADKGRNGVLKAYDAPLADMRTSGVLIINKSGSLGRIIAKRSLKPSDWDFVRADMWDWLQMVINGRPYLERPAWLGLEMMQDYGRVRIHGMPKGKRTKGQTVPFTVRYWMDRDQELK